MKKTDFFAQDEMSHLAVFTRLREYAKAQPDLHWAALVDAAFDYPESDEAPYASGGINCYLLDAYQGLKAAAPWLMPLSLNDLASDDPQSPLKKLLRHCRERPMLSFVASRKPSMTLKEDWANLHWITDADNQRMLLRLADTRILPNLPQVLTPEQWAAFTAPLAHWLVINREGQLVTCPLAAKETIASGPIQLTQAQMDALMQAAEADAVIDLLAESMPNIIPADIKKSRFYTLVNDSCQLAQAHQIEAFDDTVSLAVAACLTSGASNKNPLLLALLKGKKWASGKLGEALVAEAII
jgi:hypothetical protein